MNTVSQISPRAGKMSEICFLLQKNKFGHYDDTMFSLSGPEVGEDAKPDVLTSK